MNYISRQPAQSNKTLSQLIEELTEGVEIRDSKINARIDDIEKRANRPGSGSGYETSRGHATERKALGQFVHSGDLSGFRNSMEVGDAVDGGYLTVSALSDTMTKRRFDLSPIHRLARVVSIRSGTAFEEPVDMSDIGANWVGENQSRLPTDTPKLGMLRVPLNEIYSNQTVTQTLMDTAFIDVGQWLEEKIADKFARAEGQACIIGNSNLMPRGFLAYPTSADPDATRAPTTLQHVASGDPAKITADGLRSLYWAVRAPHRANATWLMASETANAVDRLKDGAGNYLWRPAMTAGVPNELLGRPVEFSEDMPGVLAGTTPIAFGDWKSGYVIVDRAGIKFLRDPFSSKPSVEVYAYKQTGGQVANTDAIKLLKVMAS